MLSMTDAAATFNKTLFTDINHLNEFSGQLLPFNDSTRSGATSRRRILEVHPDIVVPKVIIEASTPEVFIVALPSTDFFRDTPVRRKYPVLPAESNYSIKTVKEILDSSPWSTEWGTISYIRREVLENSSEYLGGYSVILPSSVSVVAGEYVSSGTQTYRAREDSYIDELGFTVVEVVKINDLLQTLSITVKGVYDPITETRPTVTTPVPCVVEERTKSYTNDRMDSEKIVDGDKTVSTLHPCGVGDTVGLYTIINKVVIDSVNTLHCRRT